MDKHPAQAYIGGPERGTAQTFARMLWALCFLFALRVAGQALQLWLPQSFLPPFHAFQGSDLSFYWLLLFAQLSILALMARLAWRVQRAELTPRRRLGNALAWLGSLYLAAGMGRLAVGLGFASAPGWFKAWIPAVFHGVLAAFVLVIAAYHRRAPHLNEQKEQT